jgi:raffinose/stachyose/melibiose transport system permease protein
MDNRVLSHRVITVAARAVINGLVWAFTITCVFPLVWLTYSSLKTDTEFFRSIISLPRNPQFLNYLNALRVGRMGQFFLNSVFNTVIAIVLIILASFFTAYFIARHDFRGKRVLYIMYLAGMLVPVQGLLIPLFIQFRLVGLLDNRFTLLLPYFAVGMPLALFLAESFIRGLPRELDEAAMIDGCTTNQLLFKVIIPLCKPVFATIMIISFLNTWNEFPFALVLISNDRYKTIPLGLTYFTSQYSRRYTQNLAAIIIASLPVVIIYLVFNKRVKQGMTAGAIKG